LHKRILLLLLLSSCIYAQSLGEQTDWSGGDGVPGPVWNWGNEFYLSSSINWLGDPGSLILMQGILEYVVSEDFSGASSVYSEDIDGDGDMDVLGAAQNGDDITWWENIDGSGSSWIEHTIDDEFDHAQSVYSEDIDGDGDIDVLGAAWIDGHITWWENTDGSGTSWIEHIVDADFNWACAVYSEDIDADGDMDIIGAAAYDDDITWWENSDGSGTSWVEHTIDGNFNNPWDVYSEDIDDDGDMDVLGAAPTPGNITWWENTNGLGTSWVEHTIDGDFYGR